MYTIFIMSISFVLLSGCLGKEKDLITEINVEKDSVEELDIHLEVSYGKLKLQSDADDWLDGEVNYNLKNLEPKVTYKVKKDKGKIKVNQPKMKKKNRKKGSLKNEWNLQLTNNVPIDLKIETGASDSELNLAGIRLSQLNIETGVGRTTVDLGGTWKESFEANLDMGVGQTTVILPKDIGVKVHSDKGIGIINVEGLISKGEGVYVNEAYENANMIITVNADLGVGEANFIVEE